MPQMETLLRIEAHGSLQPMPKTDRPATLDPEAPLNAKR